MRSLFILFSVLPILAFGQPESYVPSEPCTAECNFENYYELKEIEIPVYIGDPENMTVRRDVYQMDLGNGKIERVVVVLDLIHVDAYEMRTYRKMTLIKEGGFKEERAILCPEEITSVILNQIQSALINEDFLPVGYEPFEEFKLELKNALSAYQLANGLPIGHLDFETLEFLGVDF